MDDDLLTPDEVCDRLKVTKAWLYDQVEAKRIPYIRLGRHLRFSARDLSAHIAEHSHPVRHEGSARRGA